MIKQESGRSMVEMLGVLAIIGVLSIGGIAGYTIAMNRYRANEILDTAAKVSVMGMASDAGGITLNSIGLTQGSGPHGASSMTAGTDGAVNITGTIDGGVEDAMENIAGDKWTCTTGGADGADCTAGTFNPNA